MTTNKIYLSEQIKAMDETCGTDSDILMQNAANAVLNRLVGENILNSKICIVCGKGNNGGDGYALACFLKKRGVLASVVAVEKPSSALAIKYYNLFAEAGGTVYDSIENVEKPNVIIDCIFGFSFHGKLEGKYAKTVEHINQSGAFIVAVDLPSGLTADTDEVNSVCVKADITCTFTALKLALASYPAKEHCGKVFIEDIGIPAETIKSHNPVAFCADENLLKLLPTRKATAHKGSFGTLATVCGSNEMCGAAVLSCLAALKSGVGLVHLYTEAKCADVVKNALYEAIAWDSRKAYDVDSTRATALLLGCGCGRVHDRLINHLLKTTSLPTVVDADGINCIAGNIELYRSVKAPCVFTPHPAEMGRLLGVCTDKVNSSRTTPALSFSTEYAIVTMLKGAATVITAPDGRVCINTTGNTGLSKGGSGDVLAGLTASLLAQGVPCFEAACIAAYLHGAAADSLANEKGVYAMLPSELPDIIGRIMYFG